MTEPQPTFLLDLPNWIIFYYYNPMRSANEHFSPSPLMRQSLKQQTFSCSNLHTNTFSLLMLFFSALNVKPFNVALRFCSDALVYIEEFELMILESSTSTMLMENQLITI